MTLQRFFGGPPVWVMIRLAVLSLVIGIIFSVLGIHPGDLLDGLQRLISRIYYLGFDAIHEALSYFLLGAIVVFPIWFVLRLFKVVGGRSDG